MMRKYHNTKVAAGEMSFDSRKEHRRYLRLLDAQRKGIISELRTQPEWTLIPPQHEESVQQLKTKSKKVLRIAERAVTYKADFSYIKDGKLVVEDVKISPKLLPKEFVLKRKMMLYFHGIKVRQVYKPDEEI